MDEKEKKTIRANSVYATITALVLMAILLLWVWDRMPVYLDGLLLGLLSNIPVVDLYVEHKSKAFKWYLITPIIQFILVIVSLIILVKSYGWDIKWMVPAVIIFVVFEVYLYKDKLENIFQSWDVIGLIAGVLSATSFVFPEISGKKALSTFIGVVLIVIYIYKSKNKK